MFDTLAYRHDDEALSYKNLCKDLTALAESVRKFVCEALM